MVPWATLALVATNIAFFCRPVHPPSGTCLSVQSVWGQGQWGRLLWAPFHHLGLFHLLLNMGPLFWLGWGLEQEVGTLRTGALLLALALLGGLMHLGLNSLLALVTGHHWYWEHCAVGFSGAAPSPWGLKPRSEREGRGGLEKQWGDPWRASKPAAGPCAWLHRRAQRERAAGLPGSLLGVFRLCDTGRESCPFLKVQAQSPKRRTVAPGNSSWDLGGCQKGQGVVVLGWTLPPSSLTGAPPVSTLVCCRGPLFPGSHGQAGGDLPRGNHGYRHHHHHQVALCSGMPGPGALLPQVKTGGPPGGLRPRSPLNPAMATSQGLLAAPKPNAWRHSPTGGVRRPLLPPGWQP